MAVENIAPRWISSEIRGDKLERATRILTPTKLAHTLKVILEVFGKL